MMDDLTLLKVDILENFGELRKFKLNIKMDANEMQLMFKILPCFESLEEFNSENCMIGLFLLRSLMDAVWECSSLKNLVLNGNPIGDEGAIEIARVLCNTQLESLDLRDTGIGMYGATVIANELKRTTG
jgi:hypothetical protein